MSNIKKILEHYGAHFNGDKCCCLIHGEKTPSFQIYEDTESWYCFGSCGKGGDAVEFVKEIEGVGFKEAMEKVCELTGTTKEEYMEKSKEPVVKENVSDNQAMDIEDVKSLIRSVGYKANGYRGIRDDINQFYGHLTKLDTNGSVLARYYPETNGNSKVTGYKCRNHPKDFSHGKIGSTGAKSQLSGQVKFKSPSKYCVPMDTKTLCKTKGWVGYDDLEIGDEILAYDALDETKKWTSVKEKHFFKDQEVKTIGNSGFSLRATDNHRWYVMQRSTESNNRIKTLLPEVRKTSELTTESRLIVNAKFNEVYDKKGSVDSISESKRNIDWVTRVLNMSHEQRISFLDGFMIADGYFNKLVNPVWTWGQNDGNLFEAALTATYLVHDGVVRVKNRRLNNSGNLFKDVTLSATKYAARLTQNYGDHTVEDVWCVTTELNTWVIRQGDTISITGNCLYVGGEEDKAAAYQMLLDNRSNQDYDSIPVVSPTSGEGSAAKQAAMQYDWFDQYDIIIIGMDQDDAGRKAAKEIAAVLPKEKIRIATWSGKDPNQMLLDGKEKQFVRDFYNAKEFINSGISSSGDAEAGLAEFLTAPKIGLPPQLSKLQTAMRGGIKSTGSVVNIIGDTSIGKSFLSDTLIYHWLFHSPRVPTIVSLERTKEELTIDLLSMHLKKNLMWFTDGHDAVDYLNQPEVQLLKNELLYNEVGEPRFFIIDEREGDIELLKRQMEKSGKVNDSRLMVIDPLTDFLRSLGTEIQENFMMWQKLQKKNGFVFINILHTRKPPTDKDGNVRKVTEYDALGSGTFIQSADINIVINRDKMTPDAIERNTTYVDMPKCRGGITGEICALYYDAETRQQYDRDEYFNRDVEEPPLHHTDEPDF